MAPSSKKPPPGTNPAEHTYKDHPIPPMSAAPFTIAGILTTVFGLDELASTCTQVSCLWLLHPRLQTQECMAPFAADIIASYNKRPAAKKRGLVVVSFDQRNHGTREVTPLANEAWRGGNPRHALDMFSSLQGAAVDVSVLMDYVGGYLFPDDSVKVSQHIVLGISLGAHAAWQALLQEPRVTAGVIVVGCPDFVRMMSDRARLSKVKSWTVDQGKTFIGSPDFPPQLVEAVHRYDPVGLLWGPLRNRGEGQENPLEVTQDEKTLLIPLLTRTLGNKRVLTLSGGKDKMVPYHTCKPFLDWVKKAIGKGGWFEGRFILKEVLVEDCGHEVPYEMVVPMIQFVIETIEGEKGPDAGHARRKGSRL